MGVLSDEIEGLQFLIDYDRADQAVAEPDLAADDPYRGTLRGYLADSSVPPLAFRRLARDHPAAISAAMGRALDRPTFQWERDGEALLREYKPEWFRRPPLPTTVVMPPRLLAHRLPTGRNDPCPCGSGKRFKRCCGA